LRFVPTGSGAGGSVSVVGSAFHVRFFFPVLPVAMPFLRERLREDVLDRSGSDGTISRGLVGVPWTTW